MWDAIVGIVERICVTLVVIAIVFGACFLTHEHKVTTRRAFELGYTREDVTQNGWVKKGE